MRETVMIKEEQNPNESKREIFLLSFLNKGSTRYPVGMNWVNINQKFFRIICIAKLSCLLYCRSSNKVSSLPIKKKMFCSCGGLYNGPFKRFSNEKYLILIGTNVNCH